MGLRRLLLPCAVVAVVTAVAGCTGDDSDGRTRETPKGALTAGPDGRPPDGWRTEYWQDVAVDVPVSWGYGGAPDESGTACYPEAMVGPDGGHVDGGSGLGYVGRPIAATDVCALVPRAWEPRAPYVWLGAAIEPGAYEYDNGYVQETVEVDGTTVTVGTDDAALRHRILDTVRGGETCLSEVPTSGPISHDRSSASLSDVSALRVCVYRADDPGSSTAHLAFADELGSDAVHEYEAAVQEAQRGGADGCPTAAVVWDTWVVLELVDGDGSTIRQDVAQAMCWLSIEIGARRLFGAAERSIRLSPELVEPWASGGVRVTVPGVAMTGDQRWLDDYFIGPQG